MCIINTTNLIYIWKGGDLVIDMIWFCRRGDFAVQRRWCWNNSYPVLSTAEFILHLLFLSVLILICLSSNVDIWWLWLHLISVFFPSLNTYHERFCWIMSRKPSPWDYIKDSISDDDALSDKTWCIPALAVCRLIHENRAVRFNAAPCTGWLIYLRSPYVPICMCHLSYNVHWHASVSVSKLRRVRTTGHELWPSVRLTASSNTTDVQKQTKSWTPALTHAYPRWGLSIDSCCPYTDDVFYSYPYT